MRVPAGPTPLIPLPPSVAALHPAAAPAGSFARTDFSGSEALRQALANAPAPTLPPKPAAPPTLTPAAATPMPPGLSSALPLPVQAVPVALQAALLAYADRSPVETMPGNPSAAPVPTPPAAAVPGAAVVATVPQLPAAATPASLSPATSATTPQDTVLQAVLRAPTAASNPAVLRQTTVIGLLRALVGSDGALPEAGLTTRPGAMPMSAPMPATDALADGPGPSGGSPLRGASRAPRGASAPTVMSLASGDLRLRFELPAQAAGGARVPLQAELLLHPTLVRYAPQLAAALAASEWMPGSELPTLPLSQGALPQALGFQLMMSPAALWPLMVCIASGQLRVAGADDDRVEAVAPHDADEDEDEDEPEEPAEADAEDEGGDEAADTAELAAQAPETDAALDGEGPLSLGTRVACWIAVQRLRHAFR